MKDRVNHHILLQQGYWSSSDPNMNCGTSAWSCPADENPLYQHRIHIWSAFFTSLDNGAGKQNETNGSYLDK